MRGGVGEQNESTRGINNVDSNPSNFKWNFLQSKKSGKNRNLTGEKPKRDKQEQETWSRISKDN